MSTSTLGKRTWFNLILFGLMGQIAWNVENMYFNTFLCNFIYGRAAQEAVDGSIPIVDAVAWMVALSAVVAVAATFLMGNLSDKVRNRRLFICGGYILWGVVTAGFGVISLENVAKLGWFSSAAGVLTATVWIVIAMDCLMTFMGSTGNDSAFNAWVTEVTCTENRTTAETVLAAMPIAAMGLVLSLGGVAVAKCGYPAFFLGLGGLVILCGILGLFTLQEPKRPDVQESGSYWKNLLYGFRPSVVKQNAQLYLALGTLCIYSTAFQVFFPYLIVYLQHSELHFLDNLPTLFRGTNLLVTVIALLAAVAVLVLLIAKVNRIGKGKCLVLSGVLFSVGLCVASFAKTPLVFVLGACPFLVGYAVLGIILGAVIRDYTPTEKTGLFQGVRMIFMVLIPMAVGPRLASVAARNSGITYINELGAENILPSSQMFLIAGMLGLFMFATMIPLLKKGIEPKSR